MGLSATRTGADKSSVGSRPTFSPKPTHSANEDKEKEVGEWRVVGRDRSKSKTARPQSSEAPRANSTYSPIPFNSSKSDTPSSYSKNASEVQTLNKPSWDKIEKFKKLKEEFDAKQAEKEKPLGLPGPSSYVPSSST